MKRVKPRDVVQQVSASRSGYALIGVVLETWPSGVGQRAQVAWETGIVSSVVVEKDIQKPERAIIATPELTRKLGALRSEAREKAIYFSGRADRIRDLLLELEHDPPNPFAHVKDLGPLMGKVIDTKKDRATITLTPEGEAIVFGQRVTLGKPKRKGKKR